jgi:hypothetical protein
LEKTRRLDDYQRKFTGCTRSILQTHLATTTI